MTAILRKRMREYMEIPRNKEMREKERERRIERTIEKQKEKGEKKN